MTILTLYFRKWLKAFHLLFVSLWVGGAVTLATRQFFISASSDGELYGLLSMMHYVDLFIIIPGATGCLLTGLIYSIWTNWGFFRHRWVTVKWAICLFGVAFGTYPLGPWLEGLVSLAREDGLAALNDPAFAHNESMLMIFGTMQTVTLVFACVISSLKPWGRSGRAHAQGD
jgi:hypothetical protein